MPVRLKSGGAYTADISSLCRQIRVNGTLPNLQAVTISHPGTAFTVDLHINMAYQPNSNLPPINGALYAVAFSNAAGTWHFNVGAIGVALPGVPFPGGIDGSYASLGYAMGLPAITDANLSAAINAVHGYAGGVVGAPVLDGMARLIIAVNEATRFDAVKSGVDSVLGNAGSYAPPVATIHNWGGHIIGS